LILSDRDIRKQIESGRLIIEPFDPEMVQPSSVDLRVADEFRVFRNTRYPFIDVRNPMEDLTDVVRVKSEEAFILHPGEFVLGSTLESVSLPDDLVGRIEGKSSLGRLGLLIHSTAGFVDAGWTGHLTLELSNVANLPITIYPAMKIGQLCLFEMTSPAERPYGERGKYQGQRGPTPSKFHQDFIKRAGEIGEPPATPGPSSKEGSLSEKESPS
jgi:dCTP deaminase